MLFQDLKKAQYDMKESIGINTPFQKINMLIIILFSIAQINSHRKMI